MPPRTNGRPGATCPDCGEWITGLDFSENTTGREYGREFFPLHQGNRDYHDSETTDSYDTEYFCPECEYCMSNDDIETMMEESRTSQEGYTDNGYNPFITWNPNHVRYGNNSNQEEIECPHCNHSYMDELATEMYCPRCSESFTPNSNKEIPEITITRNA